jgi:hypothetical protein
MYESYRHAMLLAQGGGLDDFARGLRENRFRFDSENIAAALLTVAGIALAVWILWYLVRLYERRQGRPRPGRLLWRVARAEKLRDPACLFLEPERLEAARLGPAFAGRQSELSLILDCLFGELASLQGDQDS